MQLSLLVALVAALAISENAPHELVTAAALRSYLALGGCAVLVLLTAAGSRAVTRAIERDQDHRLTWLRAASRLKQIHVLAWLSFAGTTLFVLQWTQLVRYNWGLDQIVLLKDVIILMPIWLPLLLSWVVFYDMDRAVHGALTNGLPDDAGEAETPFASRPAYVWLHARHYLGLSFLPALFLLTCQDVAFRLAPQWQDTPAAWIVCLVPLAVLTVVFPQLLSRIWKTKPLPAGPLRERLERLCQRMHVRCRDFRIWQTDRQILNAAVAGVIPAWRTVYMTDALLLYLRDEELEAVMAHELGHVSRRHLLLRLLLLGLPLWIIGSFQALASPSTSLPTVWQSISAAEPSATMNMLMAGSLLGIVIMVLGWYSRLLEHDADLCVHDAGYTESFVVTIDRLAYLCHDKRQRATWLHPSIVARVDLLQHAMHDGAVARRFRRRVECVNWLLVIIWLLAPLTAAAFG
jgi:STE24 endopeptidase